MTVAAAAPPPRVALADTPIVLLATLAFFIGALTLTELISVSQAILFVIGGLMGATLFHASFGFTGGWRKFVKEGRGNSIRAQMLMVGIAAIAFMPLLALGEVNGQRLVGAFAPVGISVIFGAALFGLGMQLGGGCGSGTLFTVGGGSRRMLVTLAFFIIGALIGTAHLPAWLALPSLPPVNLGQSLGVPLAIVVTLAALAAVAGRCLLRVEDQHQAWLLLLRRSGLYGDSWVDHDELRAKALEVFELIWRRIAGFEVAHDLAEVSHRVGVRRAEQGVPLTEVQAAANRDFQIVWEALLSEADERESAALLHKAPAIWAIVDDHTQRITEAYRRRCNIGALFSGIASGSLHGWLWFACAFGGSLVGIRIRPWFGLDGEPAK